MGALPAVGQWVRLEVPASQVGLEGKTVKGMAFALYGGRATWDRTGKVGSGEVVNAAPTASFTATPASVQVGSAVAFNAGASTDSDGSIVGYSWNFGDGSAAGSGVSTSKSYAAAGSYVVTLTVTDNQGATATTTRTVTVTAAGNAVPTASFTATPASVAVGVTVALDGSASADSDGVIANYSWNFGDGSAAGSGVSTGKSYAAAGSYVVTLTVTDNQGATATTTRTVMVTGTGGPGTETVWLDDATPAGADLTGSEPWSWVTANPVPYSGARAHQSALMSGAHQHYFLNGTTNFPVGTGDTLFTYVYLDAANPPTQVMLQWFDGSGWEHRAYWGASNQLGWGGPQSSNAGRAMGALPAVGQWVRLEVPASQVGLEGKTVKGMAFALYGGRATWDTAGRISP
jgi:PKD repeat protein